MTSRINRRDFLGAAAGASALTIGGLRPAGAQAFPARGVLVIVPYAAGGGSDISARLLARDLEPILGKPVTVENRAGGGGTCCHCGPFSPVQDALSSSGGSAERGSLSADSSSARAAISSSTGADASSGGRFLPRDRTVKTSAA